MNRNTPTQGIVRFKFEFAIILMLVNLILVFTLISEVQNVMIFSSAKQAAAQLPKATQITAAPVAHAAVITASRSAIAAAPTGSSSVIWPLRGKVTTEFGVPEPPYQPIHTGIDISSRQPAGRAAI